MSAPSHSVPNDFTRRGNAMTSPRASDLPLLTGREWKWKYESDDGDLIELFYNPALERGVRYDRTTGYFSAEALALAARGVTQLCRNKGHMRLVVGCTLHPPELEAIARGYDLRKAVHERLAKTELVPPDDAAKEGLELLAWLIQHGLLELRVAVPVGPGGKPVKAGGIYHEKIGIIEDAAGNKLTFSGSNNETVQGWRSNTEGFHVHCTWRGDAPHAKEEIERFEQLWKNEKQSVKVYDFPEAAKQRLLQFLPKDDRRITPPVTPPEPVIEEPTFRLTPEEIRRIVWTYIVHATRMENGIRVGEATSVVEPWPHQLRSYVEFIQKWPCRLLVADEVGLGKTITAGLILRQAWLSQEAKRILLLVPKGVILQWQSELYEKFNLNVPIYDGTKLRWKDSYERRESGLKPLEKPVSRTEWHQTPFVLCSSQLARRRDRAADLLEAERWDLIVLDEAHHARRRGGVNIDRNEPNALLRLMRKLRDKADSLLLLTATPMQMHPVEVYDLLDLLGLPPGWNRSWGEFVRYFDLAAASNPSESEMDYLARMFQHTEAAYGEAATEDVQRLFPDCTLLDFTKALNALRTRHSLRRKQLDSRRRKLFQQIAQRFSPLRHLMSRHTRDLLRVYYDRALIDSPIAERDVVDLPLNMTRAEQGLYEAVEEYISTTYNNAAQEERTAVGFVMTVYRRRLASSLHALRQTLVNRLAKLKGADELLFSEEDLDPDETRDEVMDEEEAESLWKKALKAEERGSIQEILKRISQCNGGRESKAAALLSHLRKAFENGYDSAIVFTQYTDTMDSLKEFVAEELQGWPMATYSGRGGERLTASEQWEACPKERVKRELREGRIKVLICTDAAGEGLNLQTCGVVANYDLPWNPMKVEQRIGRIDRIGQKYPRVRILNFAYKGTVEEDVYFSLGQRINLFRKIVGKLQPILSQLPRRFEEISLMRPEEREAAKHRVLAELEQKGHEAEASAFDIDFGAEQAAELPALPDPALTLDQIEEALRLEEVKPPGLLWRQLDPGSFEASTPGMLTPVRMAIRAEVFDDHIDSHGFFSPGGDLFEAVEQLVDTEVTSSEAETGVFWIGTGGAEKQGETAWAIVDGRAVQLHSLRDVLAALPSAGPPGRVGAPDSRALRVVV